MGATGGPQSFNTLKVEGNLGFPVACLRWENSFICIYAFMIRNSSNRANAKLPIYNNFQVRPTHLATIWPSISHTQIYESLVLVYLLVTVSTADTV